MNPDFKGHRC